MAAKPNGFPVNDARYATPDSWNKDARSERHGDKAGRNDAKPNSSQALLARAHQQACNEGLRPTPLLADARTTAPMSAAEKKRLADEQSMWLAAYRRMLKATTPGAPSGNAMSELQTIDSMLQDLLGKEAFALLEEHCALLLASAELDAYCAAKLELAHRRICGLPITRKTAWDFAAGLFAFSGCFGAGTFLAKYFGNPWISFALNPITWVLSERMIPLVRMTTWRSEAADSVYPKIARANVRRAKFGLARGCGYRVEAPKIHRPQDSAIDRKVTQKQYVKEMGGQRASVKAWWAKTRSDDWPYFFYSLLYGARGIAWDLTVRSLALRNSPQWRALNATTHCASGMVAGALTMVTMQQMRERQCRELLGEEKYRAAEKLTETPEIQRLKLRKLQAEQALLKARQAQHLTRDRHLEIEEKLKLKDMQIRNAQARCTWHGLIGAELQAAFQSNWSPDFRDQQFFGEVPGKLFDTLAGLLGKYECLLVYTLLVTQVSWFTVDPQHDSSFQIVLKNCVAAFMLIAPPNFSLRTEWTLVSLFLAGMASLLLQPLLQIFGCGSYVHHEDNERVIVPDHDTRATLRSRSSFMSLGDIPRLDEISSEEAQADQGPTRTDSAFPPVLSTDGDNVADENLSSTAVEDEDEERDDNGHDAQRGNDVVVAIGSAIDGATSNAVDGGRDSDDDEAYFSSEDAPDPQ